ncbi:BREX-1 system adenine-specific DNA-methyltransferase PglX [Capnocytophaga canimorsus]|uniref:BREX-1 system adenine-specific DNA-methyltransferase PglX n=1 Tax=Capnocytophaga canimorsus TaxID=28188 RepID=UPI0037D1FE23
MNTSNIKKFSAEARKNLNAAIAQRLLFWGFDAQGNEVSRPQAITGGYTFRTAVYNDTQVVPKWETLRDRLKGGKQALEDTIEEAAYTWFNRLLAIKILEENQLIPPVLRFVEHSRMPIILQEARAGRHSVTHSGYKASLQEAIKNDDDETALAILLNDFCNKNALLSRVFGRLDDYTPILLPQNLLAEQGFLAMLNDTKNISDQDYQEVELIGWLYQFYISEKKDEVFAGFQKNKKARAEDIPAATQIFTPKWIVSYMVENTLGKAYQAYDPTSKFPEQMKYRVEGDASGLKTEDITALTLMDPACGSGHILVTGFEWLHKMYVEQGYTKKQAVEHILRHNLYGLDIDERAAQLARFAVLLKASKLLGNEGRAFLNNANFPLPQIYAFPEAYDFTMEELKGFVSPATASELHTVLRSLKRGKNIGAALKIHLSDKAQEEIKQQMNNWDGRHLDLQQEALYLHLRPYLCVALLLSQKYTAVVANPPYMGQKNMNAELKTYLDKHYPMTKSDLFAVFMEVIPNMAKDKALFAMINLPSWLFLSTFENLRNHYITNYSFDSLLHMGRGIFGIDFGSIAFVINKAKRENAKGSYFRLHDRTFQHIYFEDIEKIFLYSNNNPEYKYDFSQYRDEDGINEIPEKGTFIGTKIFYPHIPQTNFDKIPGSPIAYWVSDKVIEAFENPKLGEFSTLFQGIITGDNGKLLKLWWEINNNQIEFNLKDIQFFNEKKFWLPYNKGGKSLKWYGNKDYVVNFKQRGKNFTRSKASFASYYFKPCFSWDYISSTTVTARIFDKSFLWDVAGSSCFPKDKNEIPYFVALINSKIGNYFLKILNPTINNQVENLSVFPIKIGNNLKVKNLAEENIAISKKDWDSRETSWDFVGNPLIAQGKASLTEAYQSWEQEVMQDFRRLHHNEEELNRIFIDLYGLQEELSPEVALKDITILQEELVLGENGALSTNAQVVVAQLVSYLVGVLLGRYRLDRGGLHIAHPNATAEETAAYAVENTAEPFEMAIDDDAILPLMGSGGAFPDDAVRRIEDLVYHIWGAESHTENLNFINRSLGMPLEKWLTEKYWEFHSKKQYSKKPIYWLFCSNSKKPQQSAFRVLVYMHRMDAFTVQKVMRQYLHPHQEKINKEWQELKERETHLSREEAKRLETLTKHINELKEYNENLKKYADQQLVFDLDEGVSQNYQKLENILAKI